MRNFTLLMKALVFIRNEVLEDLDYVEWFVKGEMAKTYFWQFNLPEPAHGNKYAIRIFIRKEAAPAGQRRFKVALLQIVPQENGESEIKEVDMLRLDEEADRRVALDLPQQTRDLLEDKSVWHFPVPLLSSDNGLFLNLLNELQNKLQAMTFNKKERVVSIYVRAKAGNPVHVNFTVRSKEKVSISFPSEEPQHSIEVNLKSEQVLDSLTRRKIYRGHRFLLNPKGNYNLSIGNIENSLKHWLKIAGKGPMKDVLRKAARIFEQLPKPPEAKSEMRLSETGLVSDQPFLTKDSNRPTRLASEGIDKPTASLRDRTSVSRVPRRSLTSPISSLSGSTTSDTERNSPRRSSRSAITSWEPNLSFMKLSNQRWDSTVINRSPSLWISFFRSLSILSTLPSSLVSLSSSLVTLLSSFATLSSSLETLLSRSDTLFSKWPIRSLEIPTAISSVSSRRELPWTSTSTLSSLLSNAPWLSASNRTLVSIFSNIAPTSVAEYALFLFALTGSDFFIFAYLVQRVSSKRGPIVRSDKLFVNININHFLYSLYTNFGLFSKYEWSFSFGSKSEMRDIDSADLKSWIDRAEKLFVKQEASLQELNELATEVRGRLKPDEASFFKESWQTFSEFMKIHKASDPDRSWMHVFFALSAAILSMEKPELKDLRRLDALIQKWNLNAAPQKWNFSLTLILQLVTNKASKPLVKTMMRMAGRGIRLPGEYKYKMAAFALFLLGMHVKSSVGISFDEIGVDFNPRVSLGVAIETLQKGEFDEDVPEEMREELMLGLKIGLVHYLEKSSWLWSSPTWTDHHAFAKLSSNSDDFKKVWPLQDFIVKHRDFLAGLVDEIHAKSQESNFSYVNAGIPWLSDHATIPFPFRQTPPATWDRILLNGFDTNYRSFFIGFMNVRDWAWAKFPGMPAFKKHKLWKDPQFKYGRKAAIIYPRLAKAIRTLNPIRSEIRSGRPESKVEMFSGTLTEVMRWIEEEQKPNDSMTILPRVMFGMEKGTVREMMDYLRKWQADVFDNRELTEPALVSLRQENGKQIFTLLLREHLTFNPQVSRESREGTTLVYHLIQENKLPSVMRHGFFQIPWRTTFFSSVENISRTSDGAVLALRIPNRFLLEQKGQNGRLLFSLDPSLGLGAKLPDDLRSELAAKAIRELSPQDQGYLIDPRQMEAMLLEAEKAGLLLHLPPSYIDREATLASNPITVKSEMRSHQADAAHYLNLPEGELSKISDQTVQALSQIMEEYYLALDQIRYSRRHEIYDLMNGARAKIKAVIENYFEKLRIRRGITFVSIGSFVRGDFVRGSDFDWYFIIQNTERNVRLVQYLQPVLEKAGIIFDPRILPMNSIDPSISCVTIDDMFDLFYETPEKGVKAARQAIFQSLEWLGGDRRMFAEVQTTSDDRILGNRESLLDAVIDRFRDFHVQKFDSKNFNAKTSPGMLFTVGGIFWLLNLKAVALSTSIDSEDNPKDFRQYRNFLNLSEDEISTIYEALDFYSFLRHHVANYHLSQSGMKIPDVPLEKIEGLFQYDSRVGKWMREQGVFDAEDTTIEQLAEKYSAEIIRIYKKLEEAAPYAGQTLKSSIRSGVRDAMWPPVPAFQPPRGSTRSETRMDKHPLQSLKEVSALSEFIEKLLRDIYERQGLNSALVPQILEVLKNNSENPELARKIVYETVLDFGMDAAWQRSYQAHAKVKYERAYFSTVQTELKDLPDGAVILDVGAGSNDLGRVIAKYHPDLNVIGSELDMSRYDVSSDRAYPNLSMVAQRSATELPASIRDDSVDVAIFFAAAHHMSEQDLQLFLKEITRVLKIHGKIILIEDTFSSAFPLLEGHDTNVARDLLLLNETYGKEVALAAFSIMDWIANILVRKADKMPMPYNFHTIEEWKSIFNTAGFENVVISQLGFPQPPIYFHQLSLAVMTFFRSEVRSELDKSDGPRAREIDDYFQRVKSGDKGVFGELLDDFSEEGIKIALGVFEKCLFELSSVNQPGVGILSITQALEEMRRMSGSVKIGERLVREQIVSLYARALYREDNKDNAESVQTNIVRFTLLPMSQNEAQLITDELVLAVNHVLNHGNEYPKQYAFETLQSIASNPETNHSVRTKAKQTLEEAVLAEFKTRYPEDDDNASRITEWIQKNFFTSLRLKNIPEAFMNTRRMTRGMLDEKTEKIKIQGSDQAVAVKKITFKNRSPDIPEMQTPQVTIKIKGGTRKTGDGQISISSLDFGSADFPNSYAIIIVNKTDQRFVFLHALESTSSISDADLLSALGEGEREAIYIGSIHDASLAEIKQSEEDLIRRGIKTHRIIEFNQPKGAPWAVVYRPSVNQIIIWHEGKPAEAFLLDASRSEMRINEIEDWDAHEQRVAQIKKFVKPWESQDNDFSEAVRMALISAVAEVEGKIDLSDFQLQGGPLPTKKLLNQRLSRSNWYLYVLNNLFVNALHAMAKSPEKILILETGYDEAKKADFVRVRDTGHGIPEEAIGEIWNRDYSKKPAGIGIKGTGQGMSIIKDSVSQAKGMIEVESEVGKGTTFTILFPVPEENRSEVRKRIDTTKTTVNRAVVFVDAEENLSKSEARKRAEELAVLAAKSETRIVIFNSDKGARNGLQELLTPFGLPQIQSAYGPLPKIVQSYQRSNADLMLYSSDEKRAELRMRELGPLAGRVLSVVGEAGSVDFVRSHWKSVLLKEEVEGIIIRSENRIVSHAASLDTYRRLKLENEIAFAQSA